MLTYCAFKCTSPLGVKRIPAHKTHKNPDHLNVANIPDRPRQMKIAALLILALLAACGRPTAQSPVRGDAHACLTEAIYFEARGTSHEGQRAVGEVILNRATDPRFPTSVCAVVDERSSSGMCQFSYRCDGRSEEFGNPSDFAIAKSIARELLQDRGTDITKGALFFHAASMAPGWFGTLRKHGTFGGNIFYSS